MENNKKIVKPEIIEVVKELPTQQVRSYVNEEGVTVNFITREEALTKILNNN